MIDNPSSPPSFNLWNQPWITLEGKNGAPQAQSIEQALLDAPEYRAIYDSSPLVVVGIQRLLTAITQAIIAPRRPADIRQLWQAGQFPADKVRAFGEKYAQRFDLFSAEQPFLQSADLPLQPAKKSETKTVAYLIPETPSGTGVIHFRHLTEEDQALCPACAAAGLVVIPCFATSGGAGIKPSINGVPPLYVLPGGASLFESLVASLALPDYQPSAANREIDRAWWLREALVRRGEEISQVGYLHSLTFPARRVRLHPETLDVPCSRCGSSSAWGVRSMIFEMGECRPKDSAFWQDPFAAYRQSDAKGEKPPIPIRPNEGKALWREFGSLFLRSAPQSGKKKQYVYLRPSIIDQLSSEGILANYETFPFRCVGLRTDMKAKIFEWIDAEFAAPPALFDDDDAALQVQTATQFAQDCAGELSDAFRRYLGAASRQGERYKELRSRMIAEYWIALAAPFRQFVLDLIQPAQRTAAVQTWGNTVLHSGLQIFEWAGKQIGDDAEALRKQALGQRACRQRLGKKLETYLQGV